MTHVGAAAGKNTRAATGRSSEIVVQNDMENKLLEKWNQSHQRIPKDKSVS